MSFSLFFHTVRHLRTRQIAGRALRVWRSALERPAAFARRRAPEAPDCRWSPRAPFLAPAPSPGAAELGRGRFCFQNRVESLGWPPRWTNPQLPKLWRYHLHYFDYLWELEYRDARGVVDDWIARHDLRKGRVGWEPYPVSLRLLNWCSYFFGNQRRELEADGPFRDVLWRSVFLQAEWLSRHLETHLLGNHLLENAAALALCGSCFAGPDAQRWRRLGVRVLREEIAEQIAEDGGHFERSPMYHARATYLLACLANTGCDELVALVREPLGRMLRALAQLCHPDGEIALFNDSALAAGAHPEQLRALGQRVCGRAGEPAEDGIFALPETGYYGARGRAGHYLICDAGPVGPDYLPGHAHGDIFSFELSLGGRRVIVDSGVHGYEADEMRRYCRSTRAHNTVEIAGRDQCEFWAAFRVGRRGRPRDVRWEGVGGGFRLSGWHDGYTRLDGRPIHHRQLRWHERGVLLVKDTVKSSRPVSVASRIHLHPDCEIAQLTGDTARLRYPGGEVSVRFAGEGELTSERSYYCPEFGRRLESRALVYSVNGREIAMGFCVAEGGSPASYDLRSGARLGSTEFGW
ncbi:MAG: alginate lyase family protein [Myxococcota bacterium]